MPRFASLIFLPFTLTSPKEAAAFARFNGQSRTVTSSLNISSNAKASLLSSLNYPDTLNDGSKERTQLLNSMIEKKIEVDLDELLSPGTTSLMNLSSRNPGSLSSISSIGPGKWKVVYAPHMSIIAKLAGGLNLDIQYILHDDLSIESHARFSNFPFLSTTTVVYLSVSGTYSSVSNHVCRVTWTEAWVKALPSIEMEEDAPYWCIDQVPNSFLKTSISLVGRWLFIQPFSVFPVSYLSHDLTVFDFELLGTRICARRVS